MPRADCIHGVGLCAGSCNRAREVKPSEDEYVIECLGDVVPGWYFVSRLHGLTRAVELAAVMREIKGHPSRVRPAVKRIVVCDGPIPMLMP